MTNDHDIPDALPKEAYDALVGNPNSVLIDVRTETEWRSIGVPAMQDANPNVHFISWQFAPDMRVNESFLEDMKAAGIGKNAPIYFLCRSGVRSRAAATLAAAAGYGPCFNIAEGFEGVAGPDGNRHGGWQGNKLPETKPA